METIDKVLKTKSIEELRPAPVTPKESKYAKLTQVLVEKILVKLVEGKSPFEIRQSLLEEGKSIGKRTIRLIDTKRKAKIAELTPTPEVEEMN